MGELQRYNAYIQYDVPKELLDGASDKLSQVLGGCNAPLISIQINKGMFVEI